MGNKQTKNDKVVPYEGVKIGPASEDTIEQAIEAFDFLRINGFSVYEEKGDQDDDGKKDANEKKEPWQTEIGTFNVHSISETERHDCQKSDRIGSYTSKYDFNSMSRKYLPANKLGLKCLRHQRQYVNWDVFSGFSPKINFQMMDHSMNSILQWISQNRAILCEDSSAEEVSIRDISVDFVCMRGVLAGIMEIPYFTQWKRKTWGIGAVKFGRTIYMTSLSEDKNFKNLMGHKLAYSGHRFEEYMTYPVSRNTFESIENGVCYDFCCVYQNKSLKHNVIYAGKIDCIDSSTKNSDVKDMDFKELKIMKIPDLRRETAKKNLIERAREMWIKAVLTDLSGCVVGFRKDLRFVNQIHEVSTQELQSYAKNWSPHRCINSLNDVLDKMREFVVEEKVCYRVYFTGSGRISFMKTRYTVDSILPEWFLQEENSNEVGAQDVKR
ncbi:decapping and exoribonuclease protein-like [Brevipalpus obovatus]|uniref:decapping and exoribonuclease protein-like n=1 Tax=Brevipalpus obovatus TaxID=246614 RepID=UPI003D9EEA49